MIHISCIGLGAMGASYLSRLATLPKADVRVIAEGARAERLKNDGVVVNGTRHDFHIVTPDEIVEPADLMIVGVKYTQFAEALDQMAHHIGPNTVVISLLNGITSEDEIAARYPQAHVLYSITFGVDAVRKGHDVSYTGLGIIAFGDARNEPPYSDAVRWLADVCDQCGLAYQIPPDMIRQLWWKLLVNDGVNQVTAILHAPYAAVQHGNSPAHDLMLAAQREVVAVAQATGIDLSEEDIDAWEKVLAALGPEQYTSMAQDILAGRPTETDIFAGQIRKMGNELGVLVPVNTVLHQILKATEWRTAD